GGVFEVFTLDRPGGTPRKLTAAPGGVYTPAFDPGGGRLAFATYGAGGAELREVPLTAGTPAPVNSWLEPPAPPAPPAAYPTRPYAPDLRPLDWFPLWAGGPGVTVEGADQAGTIGYTLQGGWNLLTGQPEAGASLTVLPARAWQLDLAASLSAHPSLMAAVTRRGRLEDPELGAFGVEASLGGQLGNGGSAASAGLTLDGLTRDAFGYPTGGWSLGLAASLPAAGGPSGSLATTLAGPLFGLPWTLLVTADPTGVETRVGPRWSLDLNLRAGDGILSLDRLSLQPWAGGHLDGGLDGRLGLDATLDATLSYYVPASAGLGLAYSAHEGWSVRFLLGLPLQGSLHAFP
ncbi:MAG TPA: hypothetical protein VHN99_02705, partial [Deinococcales bacterium]|nr:hypothetical protein [Deinococcales bacterium]